MKKLWILALVLLAAAAPGVVMAEDGADDTQTLNLDAQLCGRQGPTATGETGLFTLRSGFTLCKGQTAFSTYYNIWNSRMTGIPGRDPLWNDWRYEHQQLSIAGSYGLSDKVEISVALPYHWYEADDGFGGFDSAGNALFQGGRLNGRTFIGDLDQSGIGDVRVGTKVQIAERGDYGLAFNAFLDIPTGDDDEGVVTGELGFGLGLNWSKGAWVFNLGYSDPGEPDFGEVSPQVDLGIGYAKSLSERFQWITEIVGAVKTDGDDERDEADITTGGRVQLGDNSDWAFNFGVRLDLSDDDISGDSVGGLVGLTWSPRRSYDLTTSVAGECSGTVAAAPEGSSCGGEGKAYGCSKSVTLVATPENDCCTFDSWSGDCSGTDPETTVTMDGHKMCTANFKKKGPYSLTLKTEVTGNGEGSGTVSSKPAGSSFECGQKVALVAEPESGKTEFIGWTGDADCKDGEVTMDADKTCVANFKRLPPPPPPQTIETCEAPTKKDRRTWPCGGSREIVYFEGGSALLGSDQQAKLCDLVAQINHCESVKICVAGRSAASEDKVLAEQRGDALAQYLTHQGIAEDRFEVTPACSAPNEVGSWVDIYLEP